MYPLSISVHSTTEGLFDLHNFDGIFFSYSVAKSQHGKSYFCHFRPFRSQYQKIATFKKGNLLFCEAHFGRKESIFPVDLKNMQRFRENGYQTRYKINKKYPTLLELERVSDPIKMTFSQVMHFERDQHHKKPGLVHLEMASDPIQLLHVHAVPRYLLAAAAGCVQRFQCLLIFGIILLLHASPISRFDLESRIT